LLAFGGLLLVEHYLREPSMSPRQQRLEPKTV